MDVLWRRLYSPWRQRLTSKQAGRLKQVQARSRSSPAPRCLVRDPLPGVQAGRMPSQQPNWALLGPDLWRKILTCARPCPITARQMEAGLRGSSALLAWIEWLRLVATVSTASRALHSALLGPKASQLWEFVLLPTTSLNWGLPLSWECKQGVQRLLLRQAHRARRALVLVTLFQPTELAAAMASLSSVQELLLWLQSDSPQALHAACALAFKKLASRPRSLAFSAGCIVPSAACLQGLQRLRLHLHCALPVLELRALADWLPKLQRLELALSVGLNLSGQELLRLLRADELLVQLTFISRGSSVGAALEHLTGTRLHTLELCFDSDVSFLSQQEEQLLARCLVSHRVVLCTAYDRAAAASTASRLSPLASGATVVCTQPTL